MPSHDKPPPSKPPHDKPTASKPPARKRLTIDISEAHHLNPRLLAASGVGRRAAAAAASKASSGRAGPGPAYAPLPSLAPLRRAHSGSELMGLTADAAAAGALAPLQRQEWGPRVVMNLSLLVNVAPLRRTQVL